MKNNFYVLLLLVFDLILAGCSKFSQQIEQPTSQENLFELLNGIKDKADVEDYGILEYELYDVPGNESADFQTFIRNYTKTLEEYVFDLSYPYCVEDNTELSTNVKIIMTNHKRNLSTTKMINPDGSTSFIFNCLNSNGKYEFYSIKAYKENMSVFTKTKENFVRRDFAQAYIRRGWVYYWKKDYDGAIADFTKAIKLDPKNAEVYKLRGTAYVFKEEFDQALSDYTELIRLDPKNAEAYSLRGHMYFSKKDYDQAFSDFTELIRLYPKNTEVYSSRGLAYLLKHDYDKAIADYTKVISLDPKNAEAYSSRGLACYRKDDYDKAITDYTKAISLDPKNAEAYSLRGSAYLSKKDYEKAIADYTEVIRLKGSGYADRGNAYYEKEDYEHAIMDYEEALQNKGEWLIFTRLYLDDARQKLQAREGQQ